MKSFILVGLLALGSCGSIKNFMKKGQTHQKMSERLDSDAYDMDTQTLKSKVIASFTNEHDSPMIVMPMDASHVGNMNQREDRRQELEDALSDQGFSYNKTMYKNDLDVNWMGLWKNHEKELANLKSKIKTGPYHVVEDTKDSFMIVKGVDVYKGISSGNGKSKLTISTLNELKRDPMQINMEWFKIFKTGKLWFSINEGPVSLEKSMMTAKKDRLKELSMLHYLDQKKFVAWETEASAQ